MNAAVMDTAEFVLFRQVDRQIHAEVAGIMPMAL
jgi:hypothetical protein